MRCSTFFSVRLLQSAVMALAAAWSMAQPYRAAADAAPASTLAEGLMQCDQGQYGLAVETLREAYHQIPAGEGHVQAAGALGLAYVQLRQPTLAQPLLREAFDGAVDPLQRARYGLDLANLEAKLRHVEVAQRLYDTVLRLAPADPGIQASVALNRVPLAAADQRLALLDGAQRLASGLSTAKERAAFSLNLGLQAKVASDGPAARRLAYRAFVQALAAARQAGDARLLAASQNQLAQLYEDEHRSDEALLLTTQGIQTAQAPAARDLLIQLEWRRGRLLSAQGNVAAAIGAYQRAVDQIESVRQDIPVEYDNGRSSFRDTLEPVYVGLADLLLRQASQLDESALATNLLRVRDTLELVKQTELEDFLGNRCALEGTRRVRTRIATRDAGVPAGGSTGGVAGSTAGATQHIAVARSTAVLYPVILTDRLELLVETSAGISRHTVAVTAAALRQDVVAFAAALRTRRPSLELAQRLYAALLLPAGAVLQRESIDTVVVVPDGVLRLVPFGALHDGQRFAIEQYAFAVVPAVTLPDSTSEQGAQRPFNLLLAGVSAPGAVVEKLPAWITAQLLSEPDASAAAGPGGARAMFTHSTGARNIRVTDASPDGDGVSVNAAAALSSSSVADKATRRRSLQDKLALGGVVAEIDAIAKLAPSTTLLNEGFSVRAFSEQVSSGRYSVVHIASHGVFGSTADGTFLMAHDDVITIDQLQAFLRGPDLRNHPVDLLTLSACETAEGDDRAPLGLSGAALKAQAQSALGSLWPVSDDAAQRLMGSFYGNLVHAGIRNRAKALQAAQIQMLGQQGLQAPYFWAPFILVERRL